MITISEILMGRAQYDKLSHDLKINCDVLHFRINIVRFFYGKPMYVNSGYRTVRINAQRLNASKTSWHLKCAAIDIRDTDGELWNWVEKNLDLMEKIGLWMEAKKDTPGWVHFQIFPPRHGARIFPAR